MFETGDIVDAIEAGIERARDAMAKSLLKKAIKLQVRHKRNLSRANPAPYKNPAKRGEFPKARTFNLRDAVVIEPADLAAVKRQMSVRVGILTTAPYGEYLAHQRPPKVSWKGIRDSHQELIDAGAYA